VKRVIDLIISFIGSVLATLLFLYRSHVPVYWQAFKIESLLGVLAIAIIILLLYILRISAKTKEKLKDAFDVSKTVKKLTHDDFHIAEYYKFYIERESDKEIENLLKERKYVFISGIPMLGKTRMAYEAVKKLKGFYLLRPKYERIEIQKLKVPFFKKKIVLFLDDLNKYAGKFDLDDLIGKLKKESKDLVVIATCRRGKEFDQVFAKKEMEMLLTQCQKGKIEPRKLEPEEESRLATAVGKRLERIASDGTPGSITIDLRYMKQRYNELGDEKSILKCLKLLREGNIFLWTEKLVKEVSNRIFDLNIERTSWDDYVKSLLRNGFINKFSERIFVSHDVYLDDRFLEDYLPSQQDFENLRQKLSDLKDFENLNNLGLSFHDKKNFKEAQLCYGTAIKVKNDYIDAHGNLGNLLAELKRYEEAEEEYKKVLEVDPEDARTHYNLGILLKKLKRYEEAEREYKEALRINPDYAEAHSNLGVLFDELKRYEEAEKEYKEALRINPDFAEAHYNLGILLYKLKRYDEAEKEYKEALRINPDYADAHYNLGILFKVFKRYDKAKKEYQEALRINPDDADAHYHLGNLFYDLKRYNEAEKEYKEALRINPDYAEAYYNLGILLYELKRYDEAEEEYKEAFRINPDYAEAHNNLGNLLSDLERYEEAEKEYKEALRINPDFANAHHNLGILLVDLNRKEEAKKEFEIAHDLFRKQGKEEDAEKVEGFLKGL
jgi:tetratricopeptide (TPR) repeat protein